MEASERKRTSARGRFLALALAASLLPAAAESAPLPAWDSTAPRGVPRLVQFDTDEGSWMSVSVAPDAGAIVFDLLGNIYRVPVAGGDATCLTCDSGIAMNYHPAVSPNGSAIAFVSDRAGQDNLWLMDVDGSNPRPLMLDPDSRFAEPAWIDARTLVVNRRLNTASGIYLRNDTLWKVDAASGAATALVPREPPDFDPGDYSGSPRRYGPSPDKAGYVYFGCSNFDGEDHHVERVSLIDGRIERVTESKDIYRVHGVNAAPMSLGETAPQVSPDGRWLAFIRRLPGAYLKVGPSRRSGRSALWLRSLETGAERVLMDPVTYDAMSMQPLWKTRIAPGYQWFPDAKSIAISEGGRLRRVWLEDGRIDDIPFRARVVRQISEQVRARTTIKDQDFEPHDYLSAVTAPNGRDFIVEALGQLWRGTRDSTVLKALSDRIPGELQRYAAWSPTGKEVLFVSSSGDGHSTVWRQRRGGAIEPLTRDGAEYVFPFFSADGKKIYASRWPPGLTRVPTRDDPYWELVQIVPGARGPTRIATSGAPVTNGTDASGRFLLLIKSKDRTGDGRPAEETPPQSQLESMGDSGTARRVEFRVMGSAESIVLSPNGRWAAIEKWGDIYLADRGSQSPDHAWNVLAGDPSIQRLTVFGGRFPHWIDSDRLEFISAQTLMTFDTRDRSIQQHPLRVVVPRAGGRGTLALTNVRLITLGSAGVIERGTIVIRDHRIACVGACSTSDAQVIDMSGLTLIPGWVDVHAHELNGDPYFLPVRRSFSAASLAYGVTTVHDPFTPPEPSLALGDLIEAGRLVGPRSYTTAQALECSAPGYENNRPVQSPADASHEVVRRARLGVLSIKDYRLCTRSQRQWVIEAAREAGLTVTNEGAEPEFLLGEVMSGATGWEHPIEMNPAYGDLIKFLGAAGAHYSQQFELVDHPAGRNIGYFQGLRDWWADPKFARWTPWQYRATRRVFGSKPIEEYSFPIQAAWDARLVEAGGYLPLGSHGEFHGLGMHWEVWAYAASSSPLAALRSASMHGAHFLGLDRELGSLEPGKLADMMALKGNPLDDIHTTLALVYVMKAGALYDAETLDEKWPKQLAYGARPWTLSGIDRTDTRSDQTLN